MVHIYNYNMCCDAEDSKSPCLSTEITVHWYCIITWWSGGQIPVSVEQHIRKSHLLL